jgi:hypothetical protein
MMETVCRTQAELYAAVAAKADSIVLRDGTFLVNSGSRVYANAGSSVDANSGSSVDAYGTACIHGHGGAVRLMDLSVGYDYGSGGIVAVSPRATILKIEYPTDPAEWCAMKGIEIVDGHARMWKVVRADLTDCYSGEIKYEIGTEVVAPDWLSDSTDECGNALHMACSQMAALGFARQHPSARLLEVDVALEDCRCHAHQDMPQKIRARACKVLREVEVVNGRPVEG